MQPHGKFFANFRPVHKIGPFMGKNRHTVRPHLLDNPSPVYQTPFIVQLTMRHLDVPPLDEGVDVLVFNLAQEESRGGVSCSVGGQDSL